MTLSDNTTPLAKRLFAYVPINLAFEEAVEIICYGKGWALIVFIYDVAKPQAIEMEFLHDVGAAFPKERLRRIANPLPHPPINTATAELNGPTCEGKRESNDFHAATREAKSNRPKEPRETSK